ncbi:MAG: arsenate reductase ArsC [candidate division WOR-3 bacterium]
MNKKRIIFICTHNSARSIMAEAILKHLYGDKFEVFSAGTNPSSVKEYTKIVLNEINIDTSGLYSKHVNEFLGQKFDYVITVCDNAKETCPFFPGGKNYIHKSFEDPISLEDFRRVRDKIYAWIKEFFDAL